MRPRDLRERVALFFAGLGALLSLALAVVVYEAAHDLGRRLIDETLSAELDDYIARRTRNPASPPPSGVVLQGYVRDGAAAAGGAAAPPPHIAELAPGWHDLAVGSLRYRAAVVDRGNARFYLLHDESLQLRREERFLLFLGAIVVAATLLSALGGMWLSRAVVAPLAELAAKVRNRGADADQRPLADDFTEGEIGELARVFDRHLLRMSAFIERERAFGADMSHELRTSLAVILGATEILLDDPALTEKQQGRVARIDRAARDMAEFGTALLLMAREEYALAPAGDCLVAAVIERAVERHRHLLAHKPVQVELRLDPALRVPCDSALVDIVAGNLIRNAFSYTASGTVSVRMDGRGFTVADTGKGMAEHVAGQAFLRHFRDMAGEGAGIGLSLVKRICDRQGWRVRLESRENRGTAVSVEFH